MKSRSPIANSLSRIIVSLLLTCPIFVDYAHDTPNAGFALALPSSSKDYLRNGPPTLRQGLAAGTPKARRSVFERHGDDHGHAEEHEDQTDHDKVMDMFDVDLMASGTESEVDTGTAVAQTTDSLASLQEIDDHDKVSENAHDHEHWGLDKTVVESAPEHAHINHSHDGAASSDEPQNNGHVHHSSSWVPLTEFNETDVYVKHGSAPLSFLYHDFVLSPADTIEFRRTGLSSYGNATTEMSSLQQDDLVAWQHAQYALGAGSREEDRVMGGDGQPHPGLMALHVVSFSLAYFAALPVVLALRAAKLNTLAYGMTKLVFGALVFIGWISGVWYKNATPDLYVGHKHNISGNLLLLATVAIGAIDLIAVSRKLYRFATSGDKNWKSFVGIVMHSKGETTNAMDEYERVALANQMELTELDDAPGSHEQHESFETHDQHHHARGNSVIFTSDWANRYDETRRNSRNSTSSDTSTLRDSPIIGNSPDKMEKHIKLPTRGMSDGSSRSDHHQHYDFAHPAMSASHADAHQPAPLQLTRRQKLARTAIYLMHFFSRGLVVWAYIVSIIGIVVYTGMGRKLFLPSLLAHLIKGSIFFWYGLLTFARYLGAFAEYGWAWNARPAHKRHSRLPSAEMMESFVIFFYGITNTWMERIGSPPGSPYTIKQVQHISIAVMFWFGGLSGMGLESRIIRRLLATSAVKEPAGGRKVTGKLAEPKSYSFSFNPFPALVIGILGVAMSAHKQDYVFQVTIHALWGYCLAGFSLFRLLTYFFLWVSPPSDSVMPSRPPTEGLAAFCLACGGVLFFLSDEEIAYSAMRHAYDDGFAFLCWTVALVCFIFTWILAIMAIKGWAVERRAQRAVARDPEQTSLTI